MHSDHLEIIPHLSFVSQDEVTVYVIESNLYRLPGARYRYKLGIIALAFLKKLNEIEKMVVWAYSKWNEYSNEQI